MGLDPVPAAVDPETGVQSKDVVISEEPAVSARIYLPETAQSGRKLPVLIYYHGGGFFVESAFAANYHIVLNAVAISVEYRLAPEHLIPAAYEDSWEALKWVGSHSIGTGLESWLNEHADLSRVFLGGDSANGNLAHNTALRVGIEKQKQKLPDIDGIFLNCPYFWGKDPIGVEIGDPTKGLVDTMWEFVNPTTVDGCDDPLINAVKEARLAELGCKRVLIYVAEKNLLKDRGC